MKLTLLRYIKTAISVYFVALAFVTPLFFGTWTSELFDFNKTVLIVFSAAVLLILWLSRMTLEGHIRFRKTGLDIPLLILMLVLIASAFFSLNRLLSFTNLELYLWLA